ncbi:MAG: hypothetical protein GEV28_32220 [Actinophytocola sp.]|uniref:hypothetical protein n=1 Tax=Actinophytocola sp. TaxID=1872138 RepID=UPI0013231E04|nr:hypothetical protein [Actinophytocola sp.]MPZ84800.1 hypothetical protein [Actinophytocola sp.]
MDAWRVVATVLLGVNGLVLVLLTMARTRDRKDATSGTVALAGAISFTILVVLCVLTLTVLAPLATWILVGAGVVAVTVMMLAS